MNHNDLINGIKGGVQHGIQGGIKHEHKPVEKAPVEAPKIVATIKKKAKSIIGLALLLICASAIAAPELLPTAEIVNVNTSVVASTAAVDMQASSAYVKGLVLYMTPAGSTATVTVATSRDTIYTASLTTGTNTVYPVAAQSTNGVAANWFAPYYLVNDKITLSAVSANKTGVTVRATAIIDRQR